MLNPIAIGSLLASLLGAPTIVAPPTPPPSSRIVIDVVTVNGSGCPAGTAAVAVAVDNTAFTVTYAQYQTPDGGPTRPTDMRKNCQLSFVVHVPPGYTYAIDQSEYRGFAFLRPGATGIHRGVIAFQGVITPLVTHTFVGPFMEDWQATDTVDPSALTFAPCTGLRNLNLNNAIQINAGPTRPDDNVMSLDSSTHRFAWQRCPSA